METQIEDTNKYPLTFEEATFRKNELVSEKNEYFIHYDLLLTLRKSTDLFNNSSEENKSFKAKEFEGRMKTTFNYHPKTDKDLFFNYHGQVYSVVINGKQTEVNHKTRRIFIKKTDLRIGENNEVVILFSSSYGHSGAGLHQFIDPSDKKEYLYTQFEPFECGSRKNSIT